MDEHRARQTAELTLLATMYPTELTWRSDSPPDLETAINFTSDPSFAITLHPSYTLEVSLPFGYPSTRKPSVYLSCGGDVSTRLRKHVRAQLADIVDAQDEGVEILDLIVTAFQDLLPDLTAERDQPLDHPVADEDYQTPRIKRVVIWSHHLLATSKRRNIQSWSKELHLGGFARPGYPGSVFAEGDEDQVDEFVRRLKQLRWQALQVRGEETEERRVCATDEGIVEVESLGDIAEALKKCDPRSAELFLQGMKITKTE